MPPAPPMIPTELRRRHGQQPHRQIRRTAMRLDSAAPTAPIDAALKLTRVHQLRHPYARARPTCPSRAPKWPSINKSTASWRETGPHQRGRNQALVRADQPTARRGRLTEAVCHLPRPPQPCGRIFANVPRLQHPSFHTGPKDRRKRLRTYSPDGHLVAVEDRVGHRDDM